MANTQQTGGVLATLSDELAGAVERGLQAVVTVEARRRLPASGIVWAEGGIVVTADHVVEREEDIEVVLPDGQKVAATLAGRDPGTDVAVLRLAGAAPKPADIVAGDEVKVGHLALALGRVGQGMPTASFGIVSAIGGPWRTARGGLLDGYVRADVTLYPGFSGGPLVDLQGRLIGMNSSHLAGGQAVAVPVHALRPIVEALLTRGQIRRGYLGVSTQPVRLPSGLRQSLGLQQERGLVVLSVAAGSPAEQAGLLIGDVLIGLAGQAIADADDLQAALGPDVVGKAVLATVIRGGARVEIGVTPGERS